MNIIGNKGRFLSLCAVLVLAAAGARAETAWRFSYWGPPQQDINRAVFAWGDRVAKATEGRVKPKFLTKPVGSPPAHHGLLQKGVIDMAYFIPGYTTGRFLLHQVAEFPFLSDSAETRSVAYWRVFDKHLKHAKEYQGVTILTVFTLGGGVIANSKRPIRSVDDLRGLKFRVPTATVAGLLKPYGIVTLFAPITKVHEMMTKGVADGLMVPYDGIKAFRLEKLTKFVTVPSGGLYSLVFKLGVNERSWSKISTKDKQAIVAISGEKAARAFGKSWDKADSAALAFLKENKIEFTGMSPAFQDELARAFVPFRKQWIDRAKGRGADGKAALAMFEAEIKKLTK